MEIGTFKMQTLNGNRNLQNANIEWKQKPSNIEMNETDEMLVESYNKHSMC